MVRKVRFSQRHHAPVVITLEVGGDFEPKKKLRFVGIPAHGDTSKSTIKEAV
jgi:hypothetical protein